MNKVNPEEKPKAEVARKVIAAKRKYFVPGHGEVEAADVAEVEKKVKKEVGDAN
ncbi:hypothetical protein [Rathayibacter sp. AY1C5]|uniref:hypothetical protein n=1 Tax=Rathayibacter sp. AY1C5 TaxID=2080538 RepID=UPI0015E46612|nr:hypothetical protein [Rathayibacter sp. AY1C5]